MQLFSPFHLFFWAGLVCLSAIKGLLSPRWFIYVFNIPRKNILLISYNVNFNTDLILITFYTKHYIKHIWFKVWTDKCPDLLSFGFILPAKNTETVQTHKIVFPKWREVSSVFFLYYAIGRLLTRQHTHNKSAYTANNSPENDNGPEY